MLQPRSAAAQEVSEEVEGEHGRAVHVVAGVVSHSYVVGRQDIRQASATAALVAKIDDEEGSVREGLFELKAYLVNVCLVEGRVRHDQGQAGGEHCKDDSMELRKGGRGVGLR